MGTYPHKILATTLTEPRWPLQPRGTQWFLRIGLFVVRAISLGSCRSPIEYLTSLHPCGRLSKIPNSQIHKGKKWKILSNFRQKDFFVISHERKDRFFVVIWRKKTPIHIQYRPRIDPFFPKNQNFAPKHKILKNQREKFSRFHYCQISNFWFFKSALLLSNQFWANIYMSGSPYWLNHHKKPVFMFMRNYKEILPSEVA